MLIINRNKLWYTIIAIEIAFSNGKEIAAIEYRHNDELGQTYDCTTHTIHNDKNAIDKHPQTTQQKNKKPNTTTTTNPIHPRWTASAEAVIFNRVGTAKYTLVERVDGATYFLKIPTTPGTQALNSTSLNQDFSAGFRLGAAYRVDTKHEIALSFFHIDDWNASRSIGPDYPLDWLVMRSPGGFFQTQDFTYQSMKWNYSTKLYNTELNMQKKLSNVISMLTGFRWLHLHENLQGTIPPPDQIQPTWKKYPKADLAYVAWFENQPGTPASAYPPFWNTSTTNNLYGLQIGLNGKLLNRSHFLLNGLAKIGWYWNRATESTEVSIAKVVYNSNALTNNIAFTSELDLQCKYQITNKIGLKLGAEMLWVAGVALAPGQIKKTYSTPSTVNALGVNSNSNVLFYGGTAGLELSF